MENSLSLQKQPTNRTRGPASRPLEGGKTVRIHFNAYPRHLDMRDELAREYEISDSKLFQRILENEYKHRYLGKIRDSVLQRPLHRPPPGLDHSDPEMQNTDSLRKQTTNRMRGPASLPLEGGKTRRIYVNAHPPHVGMKDELAREYKLSDSKLFQRMLENEYKRRYLGKIRARVLQKPLCRPLLGLHHSDPHT